VLASGANWKGTNVTEVDALRLMTKVARLYHTHGLRQIEVAERLGISQSRVSRLLSQAEEAGIVRTSVASPPLINSVLEEEIERRYGLAEVHVIDPLTDDEELLLPDLAWATASILQEVGFEARTIGFTSWSATLRQMVDVLQPLRIGTEFVVELLGDLGPPDLQHAAANSTDRLARLSGARPVHLRIQGVTPTSAVKKALLRQDVYARSALQRLDSLDLALVGIDACEVSPSLRSANFFTEEQFEQVRALGAVGQVCLRFVDRDGAPVHSRLDDIVIGVTTQQLRSAKRRWAVAGGRRKHAAIRAAVSGGWVDTLITDAVTAQYLASGPLKQARRAAS
jgi:DNA-binding transcriptional regulator LsrR (DeoR family)